MTIKKFVQYFTLCSLLTSLLPTAIQAITWEDYVAKNGVPQVIDGELNLHDKGLDDIDFSQIEDIEEVKKLNLSSNQLTSLTTEIGKLTQLQYLWLSGNQLTSLPTEIGKLTQLLILHLGNNPFISLPPEIGNLKKLQELKLYNNQLTALPPTFTKIKNCCSCGPSEKKLQQLQQRYIDLMQFILQAMRTNNLAHIQIILELSAMNPNEFQDKHGNNLLHLAIMHRDQKKDPECKMIKELIAAGVDLAAKNDANQTPLELLLGKSPHGFSDIVGTLFTLAKNSEPIIKDNMIE